MAHNIFPASEANFVTDSIFSYYFLYSIKKENTLIGYFL